MSEEIALPQNDQSLALFAPATAVRRQAESWSDAVSSLSEFDDLTKNVLALMLEGRTQPEIKFSVGRSMIAPIIQRIKEVSGISGNWVESKRGLLQAWIQTCVPCDISHLPGYVLPPAVAAPINPQGKQNGAQAPHLPKKLFLNIDPVNRRPQGAAAIHPKSGPYFPAYQPPSIRNPYGIDLSIVPPKVAGFFLPNDKGRIMILTATGCDEEKQITGVQPPISYAELVINRLQALRAAHPGSFDAVVHNVPHLKDPDRSAPNMGRENLIGRVIRFVNPQILQFLVDQDAVLTAMPPDYGTAYHAIAAIRILDNAGVPTRRSTLLPDLLESRLKMVFAIIDRYNVKARAGEIPLRGKFIETRATPQVTLQERDGVSIYPQDAAHHDTIGHMLRTYANGVSREFKTVNPATDDRIGGRVMRKRARDY